MRLNLAELCIVKTANSRTNLTTLPANSKPAEMNFAGIDVLNLSLGKVRFLDLKNPAQNREFHPNVQNQVLRGIKTPGDFYGVLILIWLRSGGGVVTAERQMNDVPAMLPRILTTTSPRDETVATRFASSFPPM